MIATRGRFIVSSTFPGAVADRFGGRFRERKRIAVNIKLPHLVQVEPKNAGNSELKERESNGAGYKRQQRIPLEAARSSRVLGPD